MAFVSKYRSIIDIPGVKPFDRDCFLHRFLASMTDCEIPAFCASDVVPGLSDLGTLYSSLHVHGVRYKFRKSSLRVLQEQFAKHADVYGPSKMVHTVIPSWYKRPGYVKAMADLIRTELDSFTDEELADAGENPTNSCARHVLFSAHGVPASYIQAGDPYQRQIKECVEEISKALSGIEDGVEIHLSYQSRVGPIECLRPYTDDVLPELGDDGVKNIVVVPISFVSEHIETLEEIDIEYRELAHESGILNWRHVQH